MYPKNRNEEEPLNRYVPTEVVLKHVILAHKKEMEVNRQLRIEMNQMGMKNHSLGRTIQSLEKVISELRAHHKEWTREIHAEDLYSNQQVRLAQMKAEREKMRERRDAMITKCNQYEEILREHHLLPDK